ncbi:MAG: hypothetical protein PHE88_06615 [Elusimicrobia bacterium]|nr:hypothetical protein [Elusimicrobiota bacterium]
MIAINIKSAWTTFEIRLRSFLRKVEVDKAVLYGILARIFGIVAAPVTALFIVAFFTSELQGYYYTFRSLLALQTFIELGLGIVIIQFASHEWSKLSLDGTGQITGDETALSRLSSLAIFSLKWYSMGGLVLTVGLGISGYIFFLHSPSAGIDWVMPWFSLCLLTGVTLCLVPVWSLLEGCNQVSNVYIYRFWQGIWMNLVFWLAIFLHAKLWVVSISTIAGLICTGIFFWRDYRSFLKTVFISHAISKRISWFSEIWPMQWRLALGCVCGYFIFYFFIPVLFKYHGSVIAGQMGMTWSVVGFLPAFSSIWVYPKVPRFGILIAQKEYKELDRLFWRITKIVIIISCIGAIFIWLIVYILYKLKHPLAYRMIPPLPTGLFLLAQIMLAVSIPFSSYLRAHKTEPLLYVGIANAALVIFSNLVLGKLFSVMGMAIGYLLANLAVIPFIFIIWYQCRKKWHTDGVD